MNCFGLGDHLISQSVLLSLQELLQGCNFLKVDEWVDKFFQVISVVLEIQDSIFHEGSNELGGQFDQLVLVFIILRSLLTVLDHEQTERQGDFMWNLHNLMETRQCVDGVDCKWWLKESFKIVSNNRVVTQFGHEQHCDVWVVLDDLHKHLWSNTQVQNCIWLDF